MNEQEIDLLELGKQILKHSLLILIFAILSGAGAFGLSKYVISPKYEANTSMIVSSSKEQTDKQADVELSQINANRALVSTYSEIVKSRGIADKVIANLNLDMDYEEFSGKVSIEPVKDTQIISVKVVDTIAQRAADIANETSMIFKDSITQIMNVDNVQILDKATLPEEPSSPKVMRNTAIGAMLGFILGIGIALIMELSNTRVKTSEEVTEAFDIPVLGLIPDKHKVKK
ncbi:Wzz/FepE/Etk N-terminal domain-containing protein [Anaerococcus sp. NML200574]|uniref:YveK family protein n=1 Tax=Anaerococcus sp. NML200574 TaxID=2954486 RepID=UPI00223886AC|nr:Wzz/FepE/Etk N-terminal domain-containing protein [Anaerococcus sp. NML200574]MCW6677784.1 Wzz/FepE/Etk N-terminal domain-containing protein [Anaerococcus sp. NML200574]